MRKFNVLVDDGTALASAVEEPFENIDTALRLTIKRAAVIIAEELDHVSDVAFTCEVQDIASKEAKRATIRFMVDFDD
jgi:hypothetical protein